MTLDEALRVSPQLQGQWYDERRAHQKARRHGARASRACPATPRRTRQASSSRQNPVIDYVPLARNDETIVTQFTMTTIEELGLLKMDFLGLRNLTVIDDADQRHPPARAGL